MLVHGFVIFFNGVPFIDGNDNPFPPVMGNPGNLGILLRHPFRGVNHQDNHVCPFHRSHCPDNAEPLQLLLDFAFAPQPRRVNENVFPSIPCHLSVHSVPGSPCNFRNNHAFFPYQVVNQGGLAHVWLPYNGNFRPAVFLLPFRFLREII